MAPLNQIVYFTLIILLATPVLGRRIAPGYDYGQDVGHLLQKRQVGQGRPIVTPITYSGTIPLRPELRQIEQNHEQWTLYILALSWMQYTDQTDPLSWYGITSKIDRCSS